jgi:hypothetical protein
MTEPEAPEDEEPPEPTAPPDEVDPAQRSALRDFDTRLIAYPFAVFAATRALQLMILSWMVPADYADGVRGRLLVWDADWFVRVARDGYPHGFAYDDSGKVTGNGFAFFPAYPWLIRVAHYTTGLSWTTASLTVAWIAGAIAAVLVFILGTRLYDLRVGLALCVLFCAQPMSLVLSMGYSEPVFVAFVAGMFVAAHRRAWLVAGVLGLGAALTRPTGVAAAIALGVAAALALRERGGPKWRPIVGALVALTGAPAYLLWVGLRVGVLNAWFQIESSGWGSTFDYGWSVLIFVRDSVHTADGWVQMSVALMIVAVVALAVIAVARGTWLPLTVYGLIVLVLVFGQGGYYHSKPRLLVPALLILVPMATALGRARTSTAALVLTGYTAFGLWYGAYLVTVWHYAI